MAIETGKVAYVITSDEPVFVMDIEESDDRSYPSLDPTKVVVRRPVAGTNGIFHSVDVFYAQELESYEDKAKRQVDEMNIQRKAVSGAGKSMSALGDIDPNPGFSVN